MGHQAQDVSLDLEASVKRTLALHDTVAKWVGLITHLAHRKDSPDHDVTKAVDRPPRPAAAPHGQPACIQDDVRPQIAELGKAKPSQDALPPRCCLWPKHVHLAQGQLVRRSSTFRPCAHICTPRWP